MRPYAQAIRKMTQRVAEAAAGIPRIALLEERESLSKSGSSWSPATAASRAPSTPTSSARAFASSASSPTTAPRSRSRSSAGGQLDPDLPWRGRRQLLRRLHRPPGVHRRALDLARRHLRPHLRRRGPRSGRADLQPLRLAADPVRAPADAAAATAGRGLRRGDPEPEQPADAELAEAHERAYWDYEPEPELLLPSCSRSTSTCRSSGPCSSRPLPSTERG